MKQYRTNVMICAGTGCVAAGSLKIRAKLEGEIIRNSFLFIFFNYVWVISIFALQKNLTKDLFIFIISSIMKLVEIKFIPEMWKARLSKYWITTTEELISILGQNQGSEQIAKILEVNSQEVKNFTQQLKKEIPEVIFKKYSTPVHSERFKLGALDEEEKKEVGQKC